MDRNVMLERLEWLSKAPTGCEIPEWLYEGDGTWAGGIRAVTGAALDEITSLMRWKAETIADWRPIAEAPVGEPREGLLFICLLQTERGIVGEGCARYVHLRARGTNAGKLVLRWYLGYGGRETRVCADPKYFMPLPAKRED